MRLARSPQHQAAVPLLRTVSMQKREPQIGSLPTPPAEGHKRNPLTKRTRPTFSSYASPKEVGLHVSRMPISQATSTLYAQLRLAIDTCQPKNLSNACTA